MNFFAVFNVDAAVFIDVQTQEPFGTFPDLLHIPQAAAEAFNHGLGKLCDQISNFHKKSPFFSTKERGEPLSLMSILTYGHYSIPEFNLQEGSDTFFRIFSTKCMVSSQMLRKEPQKARHCEAGDYTGCGNLLLKDGDSHARVRTGSE